MKKSHPEADLIPFILGGLDDSERARVATHLEDCAGCAELARSYAATMDELGAMVKSVPTPDWPVYRAELNARLSDISRPRRSRIAPAYAWGSLAAAGLALASLTLIIVFHGGIASLHYGPVAEIPAADQNDQVPQVPQVPQLAELGLGEPAGEATGDTPDEPIASADIGLLRDYPVVDKLDMFEDYDVIEQLDKIAPSSQSAHEAPS